MSEEYYVETVGGIDLDTKFGNLKELWESLDNCNSRKTGVARRKKDVIAAGADSD